MDKKETKAWSLTASNENILPTLREYAKEKIVKHIILMYKDKANADLRIKDLYESLLTGAKELHIKIEIKTIKEGPHQCIRVWLEHSGDFTVRHINGEFQVGREAKTANMAEAYRLCANKIGALIYGSEDRDFH